MVKNIPIMFLLTCSLIMTSCGPQTEGYSPEVSSLLAYGSEDEIRGQGFQRLRIWRVSEDEAWLSKEELSKRPPIFETTDKNEIAWWISGFRRSAENANRDRVEYNLTFLFENKFRKTGNLRVQLSGDTTYVIPFPPESELGVHGYYCTGLREKIREKFHI